jgi:hypothetical protein
VAIAKTKPLANRRMRFELRMSTANGEVVIIEKVKSLHYKPWCNFLRIAVPDRYLL